MTDFVRVRLRGTSDRMTLYEIAKLRPETERALNAVASRETVQLGGKTWHKAMRVDSLVDGEQKVLEFPGLYAVVLRKGEQIFAFNNACPHLKLPFFESAPTAKGPMPSASHIDDKGVIKCRWHESCFVTSGEIVSWCEALNEDGMSPGMPMLGDISKNRARLTSFLGRGGGAHLARNRLRRDPSGIVQEGAREGTNRKLLQSPEQLHASGLARASFPSPRALAPRRARRAR